jgi:hypothetical protein
VPRGALSLPAVGHHSTRIRPILHGNRLLRASRNPSPPPGPAPRPRRIAIDCSLWPKHLAAFALNVATYYLQTELGASPPHTGTWCAPNGRLCEVYFAGSPSDPQTLSVMVSMVKMPEAVIALAPTVGPRREYLC